MTIEERFWAKVDKSGDCWLWLGSTRLQGYGQFFLWRGADGSQVIPTAHQVAYWLTYGVLANGHEFEIHHVCENKLCVNPDHLRMLRCAAHRDLHPRVQKSVCKRGHPLAGENLYVHSATGGRHCRSCRAEARKRWADNNRPHVVR